MAPGVRPHVAGKPKVGIIDNYVNGVVDTVVLVEVSVGFRDCSSCFTRN